MEITNEDLHAAINRATKLHNKERAELIDWIDANREESKVPFEEHRLMSYDAAVAAINRAAPIGASWHFIWCIFANATLTKLDKIIPEHWEKTIDFIGTLEKQQKDKLRLAR
jgi:hypothetical protein